MTHAIRGVLLLALAGLIARLLATGQMALYMSPALDPLNAVAGVVLAAMAIVEFGSAVPTRSEHQHGGSRTEELLTYLLVALPVGLGSLVTPRALDAAALGGVGAARAIVAFSSGAPRNIVTAPTTPILDIGDLFKYLRVTGESAAGQPVRVVGIAVRDGSLASNQFVLLRYTIVHCVADAQPVGLLIEAPDLATVASDGGWVTIDGVVAVSSIDAHDVVSIHASRVLPAETPAEPYLWNL